MKSHDNATGRIDLRVHKTDVELPRPPPSMKAEKQPSRNDDGSGDDQDEDNLQPDPTSSTSAKKGRRRKAKKVVGDAMNKLLSVGKNDSQQVPQDLIDRVVDAVNADGGVIREEDAAGPSSSTAVVGEKKPVTEEEVRKAMEILKVVDMLQGKTGLGGKNKKEMGEYKVWRPA